MSFFLMFGFICILFYYLKVFWEFGIYRDLVAKQHSLVPENSIWPIPVLNNVKNETVYHLNFVLSNILNVWSVKTIKTWAVMFVIFFFSFVFCHLSYLQCTLCPLVLLMYLIIKNIVLKSLGTTLLLLYS